MRSRHFSIQQSSIRDSNNARHAVDRKSSACVVVQRIRDRAERSVRIRRERGVADRRTIRRVLLNSVGRTVDIADRRDATFVDVGKVDRKCSNAERRVRRCCSHGDIVAGRVFVVQQRTVCHRHDTGGRIDRKSSARIVVQRVSNRIRDVIVFCKSGDTDDSPIGRVLGDTVQGAIQIRNRRHGIFVDVR